MKHIVYIFNLILILLIAIGCDPNEGIYDEIDAIPDPIVGDATYTLTSTDYEDLELSYGSFSSLDDAKTILPPFLSNKYPIWGNGSSVLVGFKLYVGSAPGVSDFTGADSYQLTNADYPGAADNAVGFYPSEDPTSFLSDILAANITDPTEGQIVLAKYKQYITEPVVGVSNYYEADFKTAATLLDYEAVSVVGDQVWEENKYGAKMSGYSGGSQENEDWLISPEIDLADQTGLTFQVSQIINYSTQLDLLNILVSTNYTTGGDISAATWTPINLTTKPAGTDWDAVLSEDYDFSAYEGMTIHIAFKYESTTATSATWEIEKVMIKAPGAEGETFDNGTFYTYSDGEWEAIEGVYYVSEADFDTMGEEYGHPGYNDNFGSSTPPDDYLPTFLGIKYPFAMEEDELFVIYRYYSSSSGAQVRGNLYTAVNGAWVGHKSTIETTLQFGHDGTNWVPDNTIKYEFVKADYDYVVTTFTGVEGYESVVSNLATFGNFNLFSWDDDMLDAAINAVLLHNFPGKEEGQKFTVTISVYDGSTHDNVMYYILEGETYVQQ